jgi:hypothetical protein
MQTALVLSTQHSAECQCIPIESYLKVAAPSNKFGKNPPPLWFFCNDSLSIQHSKPAAPSKNPDVRAPK